MASDPHEAQRGFGMTQARTATAHHAAEVDRARLFALLARLMGAAPDAALLATLRMLRGRPGRIGEAQTALADAAAATTAERAEQEYHALFGAHGGGAIQPCASHYLSGVAHGPPLAALHADLARIGVERAEGIEEPEDHIAFLCETYAGLVAGAFAADPGETAVFFARHILPWAERMFTDLEAADAAEFYRAVARLGRVATAVEAGLADQQA
jgi:TorA maturation chaperone TorD